MKIQYICFSLEIIMVLLESIVKNHTVFNNGFLVGHDATMQLRKAATGAESLNYDARQTKALLGASHTQASYLNCGWIERGLDQVTVPRGKH